MKYKVLPQNAPKLVLNFGHSPLYILLNTNNADNTNIICTRISLTLLLSFYLLQESLGDVAGGDGT